MGMGLFPVLISSSAGLQAGEPKAPWYIYNQNYRSHYLLMIHIYTSTTESNIGSPLFAWYYASFHPLPFTSWHAIHATRRNGHIHLAIQSILGVKRIKSDGFHSWKENIGALFALRMLVAGKKSDWQKELHCVCGFGES